MRLRQLDFKQSIEIWGNVDISNEIANVNGLKNLDDLNSNHVLVWVTYNTIEKNLKELYPVFIEKLKYIVKKRAIFYQNTNNKTPIDALIGECETTAFDQLETLYAESPSLVDPRGIVDSRISSIHGRFWRRLENELEANKEKFIKNNEKLTFIEQIEIDKNKDYEAIRIIADKARSKMPAKIWLATGELDSTQENEMEEMSIVEVAPIAIKKSCVETNWDKEVIFDNFIDGCLQHKLNYPELHTLGEALQGTDIPIAKRLKWFDKIYITLNFESSVVIDISKGEYQNEYLRPVNEILFLKDFGSFVCLSGNEAASIKMILEKVENNNKNVFMIFLNDINGPTTLPFAKTLISNNSEIKCITLLKLFNGECKYESHETAVLETSLGKMRSFQNDSFNVYKKLAKKDYIEKGFITRKFHIEMTNNVIFPLFTKEEMEIVKSNIERIKFESIAEDYESLYSLPSFAYKLINMRGKLFDYEQSTIYKIINE